MPSYLVSAKESFVPVELYKPPIEALGETLRIKQQQYDTAFSEISSGYNALKNLDVRGEQVKELKNRYLADASNKLKNLASVDLSIPQNVQEANKVFEPFTNDQVLIANSTQTAFNKKQLADLEARQFSKDEKVRDTYHPALKEYLGRDAKRIEDAGLDITKYKDFQYRKAIPFINKEKFLAEAAKNEGLKVVHTQANGAELYEIEGGAPSLKNYQTWAASKLNDPVFNEQYMVIGTVEQERRLDRLRQDPQYANYSDDQLKQIHAETTVKQLEDSYTEREKSVADRQKAIETEIAGLTYVENPTTPLQQNINKRMIALSSEYDANKDALTNITSEKSQFTDSRKAQTLEILKANPGAYYASLARNQDITNWAAGRAAGTEQVKISKNENFWMQDTSKLNWYKAETEVAAKQQEMQMRADGTWKGDGKNSDGTDSGSSGGGSTQVGGIGTINNYGSTSAGVSNVQANKVYSNMIQHHKDVATNAVWDAGSGIIGIASKLGLPTEKIVAASTGYINLANNGTRTEEQKAAGIELGNAVAKATGMTIKGPEDLKQGLYKMVQQEIQDIKAGKAAPTATTQKYLESMVAAQKANTEVYRYEQERQRLVTENVVNNKAFSNLVVDRNGKKDMVSQEDLADQFSHMLYLDTKTNKYRKLTPEMSMEMAAKYMDGTDQFKLLKNRLSYTSVGGAPMQQLDTTRPYIEVGGKEVDLANGAGIVLRNIVERFGKPEKFKEQFNAALDAVVPNYSYFKGQTGKMGPVMGLPFNTQAKVQNEAPVRLLRELSVPETAEMFILDPATNEKVAVTAEQQSAIVNAIGQTEDELQKTFGELIYEPFGAKGGRFRVPIQAASKDKSVTEMGLDFANNKQIVFEVNNVSTAGPTIKNMRIGQQFYIYNDLREGKVIKSPEIMDGVASFKIIPNRADSSATTATTEFTFPVGDGTFKTVTSPPFPITGEGAVDPDERVRLTYAELMKQFQQSVARTPQTSGISGTTFLNRK